MREKRFLTVVLILLVIVTGGFAQAQQRAAAPAPRPACIPTAGLVGWWPFDETAPGPVADRLTVSPGRRVNGPRPVAGRIGGAFQFDGRDDYVEIPGFRLDVDRDDFSIALWLRTSSTSGLSVIVDKRTLGSSARGYSLYVDNGRLGLQLADGNGPAICTNDPRTSSCTNYGSEAFVADGAWHFVVVSVVRRAPRAGTFHIDGRAAGTFDASIRTGSLRNDGPFRVGARTGTASGFFNGQIDELQLFRRALPANDVKSLFSNPQCRDVTPAIALSPEDMRPEYASGTIIIKLDVRTAAVARSGQSMPQPIAALNRRFNAGKFEPLFRSLKRGAPGGLERYFKVSIDPRVDALVAALAYAKAAGVESAEPNLIFHLATNDPYYNTTDLWNLFKVNAAGAWTSATGAGVVVAVIDTGMDMTHVDLAGNVWTNNDPPGDQNSDGCPGICGVDDDGDGTIDEGSATDDDENGYADDTNGWDFVDGDNAPADTNGHGTHVAGTIAAIANNNQGVVGLAYGAKLMPLRGLGPNGGLLSDLSNALVYAANEGAGVINDSWGGLGRSPLMDSVMSYARSLNVVVVNAAGNSMNNACFYTPANVESAITVGSTNNADVHSSFSNAGVKLDVSAPGEMILSTWPSNTYQTLDGTSMATPHVSALAALLKQKNPGWTPEQIRQAIRMTATDVDTPGFDAMTGWGRIDAAAALQLAVPPPMASLEDPYNGSRVRGTITLTGSAGGPGFTSYDLSIGAGIQPSSWTAVSTGTASVANGVLGTFNTTSQPDGVYTLRLVTHSSSTAIAGEDRNAVIIDNAERSGWPVVLANGALKSPRVADLDGDGSNEVILGATVLDAQGNIRTGWDPDPGLGRTNSVVLDVDHDGRKEVVAAVFSCYFACNSSAPNAGAPVIYAYEPDKTILWSFAVVNPQSSPGFNHGFPSSLSAGDVDGDGQDEIVFTVAFSYNNSPYATRVFVLDAKTGVQESAFQVPGRSMSSVALVPFGAGRLLVISSDSGVYVTDASGNVRTGWPQTPGDGNIDPIAADVDLDTIPEIIVGKWMWDLNGVLKNGWPSVMYSRGSSAAGQLSKQDCDLEIATGGANGVPTYVSEHDANLIYWTFNQGETMFVMGFENMTPGNVGIADVDGDGEPEVVHQPELGFINGNAARVYGYEATSSSAALHFPLNIWEPEWVLHSTAAHADLDGDGIADMLMADGTNTLHVWSLGTPYNAGNAAPMFQHDLASTGYYPRPQPMGADLWIEDTPVFYGGSYPDTGDEPAASMAAEAMWASRAIWVRNNVNDPGPHQNPEAGQVNEIYVEVRNRGCTTAAAGNVEIYYADASVGLSWPNDWHLIGTAAIVPLAPGQSVQVKTQWNPNGAGHKCLLVRIISEPMTTAEIADIDFNVRRNNNLAWRNVNVVDLLAAVQDEFAVNIANVRDVRASIDLAFRAHQPFLADGGSLTVDLGPLFAPWKKAGAKGRNVSALTGTRVVVRALPATIEGIPMAARQKERIRLTAQATSPLERNGASNRYALDIVEMIERKEIGGVSYAIVARGLSADTDRDGIPDVRDPDDDNDGIPDARDPNPLAAAKRRVVRSN